MTGPWTIEKIAALRDPVAVVAAVREYDVQVLRKQAEAHRLRDNAILTLLGTYGVTEVARRVGMSVSHVKTVRSWSTRDGNKPA